MKQVFDNISHEMSTLTTKRDSTSFSLGIKMLHAEIQQPIYSVYGFVRFADEIVDSFHGFDKEWLLEDFRKQTYQSITDGISLNPILNSFQWVVNKYNIPLELIETFLESMKMDLNKQAYDEEQYKKYILGSAEVVGLKPAAMKLGSAFQKINFLRDLNADYKHLGRVYFPGIDMNEFNATVKHDIERDIEADFHAGYLGILELPKKARFGVYLAYIYYYKLFKKIKNTPAKVILNERVRIPNNRKVGLLLASYVRHNLNML